MKKSDFHYDLPTELIAQQPLAERSASRLLVVDAAAKRFDDRLRSRGMPGLRYEFRIIEGERHAGTKAESYTRGLRFAFAPRAADPSYP